jgi:omega-amidase
MKVTLVQTALHWEDREKNLSHFSNLLKGVKETGELIVLPEMFSTGFTMDPEKNAEDDGMTLQWMKEQASLKNSVITGSVAVKESSKFYNRLYWVHPSGEYGVYDKRHLFRMAHEDEHYTAGTKKIISKIGEWKICPQVCYDLRFPVWSRNRFNRETSAWDYDVLIYVANWPAVRKSPWKQLLPARAIENQCYVVGVNRIGKDGNGFEHSGDSVVINPRGEVISNIAADEETISTIKLDRGYLDEFRRLFPVGLDADDFELK